MIVAPKIRTVRLYGHLGKTFGREFRLAINSPAEAVEALGRQLKGFTAYLMNAHKKGVGFGVFLGKNKSLTREELEMSPGDDVIRIAPILQGSKSDAVNIIVGAVLVVVGVAITALSYGWAAPVGSAIAGMGVSMIVGGIVNMLFPQPKPGKPQERPENVPSYAFSTPVNTTAQGHPVPLQYGELLVGSAIASAGISAVDDVYVPVGGGENPGGGGGAGQDSNGQSWRVN